KDNILYAEVYDVTGKIVGQVGENSGSAKFLLSKSYQLLYEKDLLHVTRVVKVGEQDVGSLRIGFSLISLKQILKKIQWQNLFISFITLSALILATVVVSFILTRKLRKISDGVAQIREGNLRYKINVKENDELGDLAHAFNEMTQKINNEHTQMEERERHLSLTLNSIGDAVITTDINNSITRMNPVAEELTGWQSEDACGHNLSEIFKVASGKNIDDSELTENEESKYEIVDRSNHTTLINKEEIEYQIAHSAAPIVDSTGKILGTILVFHDVTKQNQTEEALRRSQKMDAIGQLSGGIAHDFNNQLNIIIGYLDFLTAHFKEKENEKPYKWVQTATNATLRCMDLTRQLLSFSRRQVTDTVIVDLNDTFEDLQTMVSRSVTPEIDVQYFLEEELWLTETNIGEFQDVIINLVINSRDAMPHGGKIVIETKNKIFADDIFDTGFEIKSGGYVEIVVSDMGVGIDKETLDHIFEPFFTTKPKGKGTGLGMAMVYGFVKRYDGYIKVYSEPNE
ncbi:MAG: ATP-binding protein, partial [Draconibacterium sp.]|nr:ATP-binding protein [Draconibacterium sp.]